MSWHIPPDILARYASRPEAVEEVTASSIEQHLMACAECRLVVAGSADASALETSWSAVADAIDQPRPWFAERVLARLGVPADLSRLVAATPGLRLAWLAAVVVVGTLAVLAAREAGNDAPFLVVAPLVPLGAVALAFLPIAEPAGEAGVAAPMHGAGLALRRTVAVLAPTMVLLAVAGLALPDLAGPGFTWVLPGLGLAVAALALSTFLRVPVAVGTMAVVWLLALYASRMRSARLPIGEIVVFRPVGQVVSAAVIAAAVLTLIARRDRFDTVEVSW
ncbi:MAG TPA: hypothetical protein VFG94_07770 [Acidimicrobiales bacterium]|nr:hypothetical protein [Acidimicrobiales bacterium]